MGADAELRSRPALRSRDDVVGGAPQAPWGVQNRHRAVHMLASSALGAETLLGLFDRFSRLVATLGLGTPVCNGGTLVHGSFGGRRPYVDWGRARGQGSRTLDPNRPMHLSKAKCTI